MDNPEKLETKTNETKYNTVCVGHHYAGAKENRTSCFVVVAEIVTDITARNSERKDS